jgi:hypothetical protein
VSQCRERGEDDGLADAGDGGHADAVEIVSPSTAPRDLETKPRLYARHGIPSYWVIDPERRELVEYMLEGNAYRLCCTAREGETFVPPPALRAPTADRRTLTASLEVR